MSRANTGLETLKGPNPVFVTDRLAIKSLGLVTDEERGWDVCLGIRRREDNDQVGEIRLRTPGEDTEVVELHIALGPDHQEDGFAREAASPVLDYIFRDLGKTSVRQSALADDQKTARLASMLGMRRETLEVRGVLEDGRWLDCMHYALTQDRWAVTRDSHRALSDQAEANSGDLWAITSFFNPARYRRHREKYQVFRSLLGVPLLAVELGYGEAFDLGPGDADRLLRIEARDVLWQKERLLNLAIEVLPGEARWVVWLDADVVFERDDWPEKTTAALEKHSIVQPYGRVFDLPPGADPNLHWAKQALLTRLSLGAVFKNRGFDPGEASTNMLEVGSPGHAWAMGRAQLEEVGFYDAMILGSGDNAMAMAALGHIDAHISAYRMNQHQAEHYRRWATRFFEVVRGDLGFVDGDLYHLWHGDLADRGYSGRYPGLTPFRFNPDQDIALDRRGAWRWSTSKPELHEYVASYFETRREDG